MSLADNPPLPFFILFEAAMDPESRGMRLGVLGSILVAEVVFGALQLDPLPSEIGAKSLKEALGKLSLASMATRNILPPCPRSTA